MNNLIQIFENSVNKNPNGECFRFAEGGQWRSLNWSQVRVLVQDLAGGLASLGVAKGDRICILSRVRYEWTVSDLATLALGAVVVPIYESNTSEQAQYILNDCKAKVVIVENKAQLQKVLAVRSDLPNLQSVVVIDGATEGQSQVYKFTDVLGKGRDTGSKVYTTGLESLTPNDLATIVYTSGTTGNPKGAILHHDNLLSAIEGGSTVLEFRSSMVGLLFLPLAHILGRVTQFYQLANGFVHAYAESIEKLVDNIKTQSPHFMVSVPRIFEKIYAKTLQNVENSTPIKKGLFHWALAVGQEWQKAELQGEPKTFGLKFKHRLAHVLVFKKLIDKLGGRIEFFVSGGAPLSPEVANFFSAFGVKILEGYGLTETTAANAVNRFDLIKAGSVGSPLPGVEMKIAEDGEILIKGRCVFHGYFGNEQATKEAIDADGWFHSGDIGEFDADGYLKITDRKKDIIITAGGKNVAPQNIENMIKNDPMISQVVIHGDKRKFLSALVTLDRDEIERYAKAHNITFATYDDLVKQQPIYSMIQKRIEDKNGQLARYETIKKFAILPNDFSVESGELTPTLKVKRKVINERYRAIFDSFYGA